MGEWLQCEGKNRRVGWVLAKRTLTAAVSCTLPLCVKKGSPAESSSGAVTESVESARMERRSAGGLALSWESLC